MLGSGANATVFLAELQPAGSLMAVKVTGISIDYPGSLDPLHSCSQRAAWWLSCRVCDNRAVSTAHAF